MRDNHYAISCISLKISYVFNNQDKHNASLFLFYGKANPFPNAKLAKFIQGKKFYIKFAKIMVPKTVMKKTLF